MFSLGFAPDYWALHTTTELCTRLLGFAPDYWALHPTTGLCTRLLSFSPDYWALHPTTRLCTRPLSFSPDNWALHPTTWVFTRLLGFSPDYWTCHPTTGLFTRLLGFARTLGFRLKTLLILEYCGAGTLRKQHQTTIRHSQRVPGPSVCSGRVLGPSGNSVRQLETIEK